MSDAAAMDGDDYFAPLMRTNAVPDAEPTNGQDLAGLVVAHPWIARWREPPRERLIDRLSRAWAVDGMLGGVAKRGPGAPDDGPEDSSALSAYDDDGSSEGDPLSEEDGSADGTSDDEDRTDHDLPPAAPGGWRRECVHPGCTTSPSFGFPGGDQRYCFSHKLPGMVNNRKLRERARAEAMASDSAASGGTSDPDPEPPRKKCRAPPSGSNGPRGPAPRKPAGVLCKFPGGCETLAAYGPEGAGQLLRCSKHKLPGMVQKMRHCAAAGCANYPWYRTGTRTGYCRRHRLPGLAFYSPCFSYNCKKGGSFGHPGSIDRWCDVHREHGMVVLAE
ncbi:hypothetical protein DFJ74DRAFT_704526 [Hyaloraphidium curvatum]|nr:hypothetical protein DFJ74DRAFT_704526 [Hyaloraphidium curvatum]